MRHTLVRSTVPPATTLLRLLAPGLPLDYLHKCCSTSCVTIDRLMHRFFRWPSRDSQECDGHSLYVYIVLFRRLCIFFFLMGF
jgi:hypothetical protein